MNHVRRLGWPVLAIVVLLGTQPSVNAFEWLQDPDHRKPEDLGRGGGPPPPPMQPNHGPMDRSMHVGPPGKWWSDPRFIQILELTPDQQKKMDDVFNQNRLRLIDLSAGLQKEEAVLEPLLAADRPDEPKILLQIDRVAQARAELEKANARMLLGLRAALTPDQWKRLQADAPRGGHRPLPRL